MDLILDTSVIIEIFGANKKVLDYLSRYNDKVFGISSITEFELFCVELKEREMKCQKCGKDLVERKNVSQF